MPSTSALFFFDMNVSSFPPRFRAALQNPDFARICLFILIVAAVWAELVFKLHTDWTTNPQYGFGDFVPLFIIFLLALRWRDRPAAVQPPHSSMILVAAAVLLVVLLPLRIVQESNPDWRPLNWVHAGLVAGFTFLAISYAGGHRFARHFLIPLMLIFLAIPWPLKIEQSVIQMLSRTVASGTTEMLNIGGIDAYQAGNVIHVPTGAVGVEDACSGIRSLAGTLMASVFIGEFYRLTMVYRVVLLGGGVAVAMLLNFVRALFLSWTASVNGIESINRWHDSAGLLIFGVSFAILWFAGDRLQDAGSTQHQAGTEPKPVFLPIRPAFLIAAGLWLLTVEFATEAWFRIEERKVRPSVTWNPVWPQEGSTFKFVKVNDEARSILRFTDGVSAVFKQSGYPLWQLFYFRWAPGRSSAQLATSHRPEICLPAAGLKFVAEKSPVTIKLNNTEFAFQCTEFSNDHGLIYVFRSLIEDRPRPGIQRPFDLGISDRLLSAWLGRRNLGQRLLQIAMSGPQTFARAQQDLHERLPALLQVIPAQ